MRVLKHIFLSVGLLALCSGSARAAFTQWSGTGPFFTGDGNQVITAISVAPDGRSLFAGSYSGTVFTDDLGYVFNVTVPIGPGTGRVTSDTGGINCSSNSQGACYMTYPNGTPVTLTATTPTSNSTFTGWSQGCTGYAPCIKVMIQDYNVTGAFGLGPDSKGPAAKVAATGYDSIANAYSASGASATILAVTGNHAVGLLTLDQGYNVTLKGGYDSLFQAPGLQTVLQGVLYIKSGSLRVENVKVKPTL